MTRVETRAVMSQNPIVIFSIGKTGTTSLAAAVETATGRPVVKAHALSLEGIESRLAKARRQGIEARPRFLWSCATISETLRASGSWDVLCGIREPIALAVSDHFYGIQRQTEVGVQPAVAPDDHAGHARAIAAILRERFIDHDWFSHEFEPVTGIDVYATPFRHHEGAASFTGDRFRALLIRAENLSAVGPTAAADFLGLTEPLVVPQTNRGTGDQADSAYRHFLNAPSLPADLVCEVYETPLAQHFYSDNERTAFAERWQGVSV
jgi:hypothetical protein